MPQHCREVRPSDHTCNANHASCLRPIWIRVRMTVMAVAEVLEGLGLFVGVVGLLGEVVDDLLSEVVAVLVAQPAEGDGPDAGVQVPAAGLPVVLQQAALLEVAHGRGQCRGVPERFRCGLPGRIRPLVLRRRSARQHARAGPAPAASWSGAPTSSRPRVFPVPARPRAQEAGAG